MIIVDPTDERWWLVTVSKSSIQALIFVPDGGLSDLVTTFARDPEITELQVVVCDDVRPA